VLDFEPLERTCAWARLCVWRPACADRSGCALRAVSLLPAPAALALRADASEETRALGTRARVNTQSANSAEALARFAWIMIGSRANRASSSWRTRFDETLRLLAAKPNMTAMKPRGFGCLMPKFTCPCKRGEGWSISGRRGAGLRSPHLVGEHRLPL